MTLRLPARIFDSPADAAAASHDLALAGFTPNEVRLIEGTDSESLVGVLICFELTDDEARALAGGRGEGGTLVVVQADEERSERAATILSNHIAVHSAEHKRREAGPEDEGTGTLSAPAPGTPGNPPGT